MRIRLDKNDVLFSKLIRERDGKCVFCGRTDGKLECSHYWGRGNKATRFSPINAEALCFSCHMKHEGNKQGYYRSYKLAQLGVELHTALEKRARTSVPYRTYEKRVIHEYLTNHGLALLDNFLIDLWTTA